MADAATQRKHGVVAVTMRASATTFTPLAVIALASGAFLWSPSRASAQQGYVDNCYVVSSSPTYTALTYRAITCNTSGQLNISANLNFVGPLSAGTNHIGSVSIDSGSVSIAPGTQVDILGNAGGILDAAGANATAPANELITGGIYQSSPASVTAGHVTQLQVDAHGSLRGVIMDAAGNARGANVNSSNQLSVSIDGVTGAIPITAATALPVTAAVALPVTAAVALPVTAATALPTQLQAATANGLSVKSIQVPNNVSAVAVKASAGNLYGIEAFNNSATIAYLKLYNAAQANVTCGAGTPVWRGMIPANSSSGVGAGYISQNVIGTSFSTGITACVTTGYADNDSAAPAASALIVNVLFD